MKVGLQVAGPRYRPYQLGGHGHRLGNDRSATAMAVSRQRPAAGGVDHARSAGRSAGRSGGGHRRRVWSGQVPVCFFPVPGEAASAYPREADDTCAKFPLFASGSWYLAKMVLGMGAKIVFFVVFGIT